MNLARNIALATTTELVGVADALHDQQERIRGDHPGVTVYSSYAELLADDSVEAVVSQRRLRYTRGWQSLRCGAGRHVMVEKPLADTVSALSESWLPVEMPV